MAFSTFRQLGGVALITGAASGMGRACAINFARAGCRLVLADINEDGLNQTVKEATAGIDSGSEPSVSTAVIDVTQDGALEELIDSIPKRYGRLDYALNAAGILGKYQQFHEEPLEHIDKVLSVNVRAQIAANRAQVQAMLLPKEPLPVRIAQHPDMPEAERVRRMAKAAKFKGSIVNFSSIAGYKSFPGVMGSYTISKHGLIGVTKVMAQQYGLLGVRTNAVNPGLIQTPMVTDDLPEANAFLPAIPAGRLGDVEDVADIALFLCSEEASYINGATLTIDGGMMS
ncbi:short-chain dehydrogenase/reductase SDR [Sistotremastrum niveocremeum HHB9708]|uniref:Short-chain dehydrogenase/reductase SDR n=2 Tax=Sistotremastraceae TaxID=3402574 RepID=A0A164NEG2_9AGAM|nr:short-chain dehydrogenase/reductase SDR [Sistotremastrum niveocremeum HHB9708]KZT32524.1 NAD(P)-binding protein [Sistotremastrum suecicum HHB10207 ss-3]